MCAAVTCLVLFHPAFCQRRSECTLSKHHDIPLQHDARKERNALVQLFSYIKEMVLLLFQSFTTGADLLNISAEESQWEET